MLPSHCGSRDPSPWQSRAPGAADESVEADRKRMALSVVCVIAISILQVFRNICIPLLSPIREDLLGLGYSENAGTRLSVTICIHAVRMMYFHFSHELFAKLSPVSVEV